ncbi:MAG: Grx4 family monothiol glutaredoxin [Candidatus Margulisiibacteriota bacterium]
MSVEAVKDQIQNDISNNKVVLFMKGTKDQPMCGFSAQVVHILNELKVDFVDRNVLANDDLRQAIKEFSDWPTIPQLYINGDFVGGCDIALELYRSGELKQLVG